MKLINLNQTVYSDKKAIEIANKKITLKNGKVLDINITVQLEYDEYYELDLEIDNKELERKLESGQICPHVIAITASYKNHSESSYLCGVLFEKAETVQEMDDNYDLVSMADDAIHDLKNSLNDILDDLTINEKEREVLLMKILYHRELVDLIDSDLYSQSPNFPIEDIIFIMKKYNTVNWIEAFKKCKEFHSKQLKKYIEDFKGNPECPWDVIEEKGIVLDISGTLSLDLEDYE